MLGALQFSVLTCIKNKDGHTQEKNLFRERITEFLSLKVIPLYKNHISEEEHYKNIDALIDYAEEIKGALLACGGYKYGVAQKLLNLALKYYWCLGLIAEPPHCPIDRIVVSETKFKNLINWTRITKKSDYEAVIEEVKRDADALGCRAEIEHCRTIVGSGTSADAQLAVFKEAREDQDAGAALRAVTDWIAEATLQ